MKDTITFRIPFAEKRELFRKAELRNQSLSEYILSHLYCDKLTEAHEEQQQKQADFVDLVFKYIFKINMDGFDEQKKLIMITKQIEKINLEGEDEDIEDEDVEDEDVEDEDVEDEDIEDEDVEDEDVEDEDEDEGYPYIQSTQDYEELQQLRREKAEREATVAETKVVPIVETKVMPVTEIKAIPVQTVPVVSEKFNTKSEAILSMLLSQNIKEISKKDLEARGFYCGMWSDLGVRGGKFGNYTLTKHPSDKLYQITKTPTKNERNIV